MIGRWLVAFVVTQAIEAPILALGAGGDGPPRRPLARWAIAVGASAITHPFVFVAIRWLPVATRPVRTVGAELLAWGIEGLWLRAFGVRRPFLWSLVANAASEGLGTLGWLWWTS